MKVNKKKIVLWALVLILWVGAFSVASYSLGQHYGKNVATEQFKDDTTAYKELKTQKAMENGINLIAIAGGLFFIVMIGKQFKLPKEEK